MYSTSATSTWGNSIAVQEGNIITIHHTGDVSPGARNSEPSLDVKVAKVNGKIEISPRLYVRHLKSKLAETHKEALKRRIFKLKKLVADAKDMGQQALYEELAKELVSVVREQEMAACGYGEYVLKEHIDKYKNKVKDRPIKLNKLDAFPRSIPAKVKSKIKSVTDLKLFDELWVLFIDYSGEQIKTNKEKIREKDPILFGRNILKPDRYFYITDWVDEHCDLTMEKFIEKMQIDDPQYALDFVPVPNQEWFDGLKEEVIERHHRLAGTKRENYKELMKEEDKVNGRPAPLPVSGPGRKINSWWDHLQFWKD